MATTLPGLNNHHHHHNNHHKKHGHFYNGPNNNNKKKNRSISNVGILFLYIFFSSFWNEKQASKAKVTPYWVMSSSGLSGLIIKVNISFIQFNSIQFNQQWTFKGQVFGSFFYFSLIFPFGSINSIQREKNCSFFSAFFWKEEEILVNNNNQLNEWTNKHR